MLDQLFPIHFELLIAFQNIFNMIELKKMTIQFKKLTQEYYHSIDMDQLPEVINDLIYDHAINTERMVDYCDGDFSHPTSFF